MQRVGHAPPAGSVRGDRRIQLIGTRTIHIPESLEVLHRNDGANLATVAGQDDPLATYRDVGDNVRKAFTHGRYRDPTQGRLSSRLHRIAAICTKSGRRVPTTTLEWE